MQEENLYGKALFNSFILKRWTCIGEYWLYPYLAQNKGSWIHNFVVPPYTKQTAGYLFRHIQAETSFYRMG